MLETHTTSCSFGLARALSPGRLHGRRAPLPSPSSLLAVSGLQRVTCVTCPLPFPRPFLCALVCTRPMSRWPSPFPSSVRDPTPEPPLRPSITRARFLGLMFTIDPPSCLPVLWRHLPSLLPPCSSVSSMKDNSYVTVPSCPRQCLGRPSTALFLLTVFRRFSARGTVCGNEPWWLGVLGLKSSGFQIAFFPSREDCPLGG